MRALELPWSVEELERRYRAAPGALAARRYQGMCQDSDHSLVGTPGVW